MPVPISTTTTQANYHQNDFFSKSSNHADDLANIYKEMLKNTTAASINSNKNTKQQNLNAQIYFKNYIQESLRFLR